MSCCGCVADTSEEVSEAILPIWVCCSGESLSTGSDLEWCGDVPISSVPPGQTVEDIAAGEAAKEWWKEGWIPNTGDITCGPFSPPPIDGVTPESGSYYFFRCSGKAMVVVVPVVFPLRWSGYRTSLDEAYNDALKEWGGMCKHLACVVLEAETFCYHSSLVY